MSRRVDLAKGEVKPPLHIARRQYRDTVRVSMRQIRILLLLGGGKRRSLQQLLFPGDQRVGVVRCNFKLVAMSYGVTRAGFDAVPAKNTAIVIDVVDLGVPLGGADAVVGGILRPLDVNAVGRASRCTKEASHALLQPILVAPQNVDAPITILKVDGLVRIIR